MFETCILHNALEVTDTILFWSLPVLNLLTFPHKTTSGCVLMVNHGDLGPGDQPYWPEGPG